MADLQQITDAIEARLRDAHREIESLQAARTALTAADSPAPRPRRAPRRSTAAPTAPTAPRRRRPATAPAKATTPPPARAVGETRARRRPPARRRRSGDLEPGQLEGLLRESEDGLSLVALAARAGVSEAKVRERLRSLQRSGEVRNSGARRTSLWRLLSDEERIAERAAELTRRSAAAAGDS